MKRLGLYQLFPKIGDLGEGIHRVSGGLIFPDVNGDSPRLVGEFYKNARPFYLAESVVAKVLSNGPLTIDVTDDQDIYEQFQIEPLAMPFATCWFESDFNVFLSSAHMPEIGEVHLAAVMAHCTPIGVWILSITKVDGEPRIFRSVIPYDRSILRPEVGIGVDPIGLLSYGFLRSFLAFSRRQCSFAEVKINHRFKIGSGKDRSLCQIKDSVDVILRKDRAKYEASIGRPVNWSHRWEVSGHWRLCEGLGKDQFGDRSIQGFTWVNAHEKGPASKDLKLKSRNISICAAETATL